MIKDVGPLEAAAFQEAAPLEARIQLPSPHVLLIRASSIQYNLWSGLSCSGGEICWTSCTTLCSADHESTTRSPL